MFKDYEYAKAVEFKWVKTFIKKKDLEKYKGQPSYYEIASSDSGIIFGFKMPVYPNEPLPHHLEYCDLGEVKKLEDKSAINNKNAKSPNLI
jgi:hypothetical protein